MEIYELKPNPTICNRANKNHELHAPIRPIVNCQNAPAYKLPKYVASKLAQYAPPLYDFNIKKHNLNNFVT